MRQRYLVAYDISDPKRLRLIFRKLHGYGSPLQYSVFVCDLDRMGRIAMIQDVLKIISSAEDRVMIVNLGPCEGRGLGAIEYLGRRDAVTEDDRGPLIV